jgi:hypothetical protein
VEAEAERWRVETARSSVVLEAKNQVNESRWAC